MSPAVHCLQTFLYIDPISHNICCVCRSNNNDSNNNNNNDNMRRFERTWLLDMNVFLTGYSLQVYELLFSKIWHLIVKICLKCMRMVCCYKAGCKNGHAVYCTLLLCHSMQNMRNNISALVPWPSRARVWTITAIQNILFLVTLSNIWHYRLSFSTFCLL